MKNLTNFSIEPPYSITGVVNTQKEGFGIENQGKNDFECFSKFTSNSLGQYILIDWFQFTIKFNEFLYNETTKKEYVNSLTLNRNAVKKLFKDLFNIEENDIIHERRGINGYTDLYSYKSIEMYTCSYDFEKMGINIKLTGKGCRDFEMLDLKWSDLFSKLFKHYVFNISRIDVAIDDYSDRFYTIPKIKKYVENGLVRCKFKADYEIRRKNLNDGSTIGEQIQFGSRASLLEITFYNKLLERQYNQYIVDNNIKKWVRCELRFRDERAFELLKKITSGEELNLIAKGVLSNYLNFLVKSPTDKNKSRWSIAPWWNKFLEGFDKISLVIHNPENDIVKNKTWLFDYVSKTDLKVFVSELDNVELDNKTSDFLKEFLVRGIRKISDKDLELINSSRRHNKMNIITKEQINAYVYSIKDVLIVQDKNSLDKYISDKYFGSDNDLTDNKL